MACSVVPRIVACAQLEQSTYFQMCMSGHEGPGNLKVMISVSHCSQVREVDASRSSRTLKCSSRRLALTHIPYARAVNSCGGHSRAPREEEAQNVVGCSKGSALGV